MLKRLLNLFPKKVRCKHDWTNHGFSSIECRKCGLIKYDPKRSEEILHETLRKHYNINL